MRFLFQRFFTTTSIGIIKIGCTIFLTCDIQKGGCRIIKTTTVIVIVYTGVVERQDVRCYSRNGFFRRTDADR